MGGARPKALLRDGGRRLIAKFSSSTDTFPLVKGEFLAMELARRAGLDAASVELERVLGKDVLWSSASTGRTGRMGSGGERWSRP